MRDRGRPELGRRHAERSLLHRHLGSFRLGRSKLQVAHPRVLGRHTGRIGLVDRHDDLGLAAGDHGLHTGGPRAVRLDFQGYTSSTPVGVCFEADDVSASVGGTTTNSQPVAVGNSATTASNTPVTINVVANDSDPDGDPLTVTGTTAPAHGTAVVNANNTVTYTPATGYTGPDSFTYAISDGRGGTASATVSITVNPAGNTRRSTSRSSVMCRTRARRSRSTSHDRQHQRRHSALLGPRGRHRAGLLVDLHQREGGPGDGPVRHLHPPAGVHAG